MSVPRTTCEACGGILLYVSPTAQRCGCDAIYIDGVRYVPYEERRCDTCEFNNPNHCRTVDSVWCGDSVSGSYRAVKADHFCKNWRRKE